MSPIDQAAEPLYSSLGGDPDLSELVEMFVDEMPDRIAAFAERRDEGDMEGLRRTAHQLKGAAGSYGFDSITEAAARLEAVVRDGGTDEQIQSALEAVLDLCRRASAGTPA